MKYQEGIHNTLMRITVAATLLLGCCGICRSQSDVYLTGDDIPVIDDLHVLEVFHEARESGDMSLIETSLNKIEQIDLPIITGVAMCAMLKERILESEEIHSTVISAAELIESGISCIERTGLRQLMYLNTPEAGVVPVRFYLANALETALKFEQADSVYLEMVKDVRSDFGSDSDEFVLWTNMAATAINSRFRDYDRALELMTPALESALNSDRVTRNTSFEFLFSFAQKKDRAGHSGDALNMP